MKRRRHSIAHDVAKGAHEWPSVRHGPAPVNYALTHYRELIRKFGAPNGLCSSITESKHIEDVKRPYRRSYQMIWTVQRLAQLKACAVDFQGRGMLGDSIWTGCIDPPNIQAIEMTMT